MVGLTGLLDISTNWHQMVRPGIILRMGPANEKRRYNVTSSLIGSAHTQNDPCCQLCTPVIPAATDALVLMPLE